MSRIADRNGDFRVAMRKRAKILLGEGDDAATYEGVVDLLASDGVSCTADLPELAPGTEATIRLTVPEWLVLPRRLDLPATVEDQSGTRCTFRFQPFADKVSRRFEAYAARARSASERLLTDHGATSALAEALRMVQAHLEPANGRGPRILFITSAVSGEGKSFLAAGLSVVLANEGRRVLLVDADLYRPHAHETFGLEPVSGTSRLIASDGEARLEGLTQEARPGLHVLTGGRGGDVPYERYAPKAVAALAQTLRSSAYDIVIVDSPPLLETAGAISLIREADDVLLAVRSRKSRQRDVRQARKLLDRHRVQLRGVVLTDYLGRDRSYAHGYIHQDPPPPAGRTS